MSNSKNCFRTPLSSTGAVITVIPGNTGMYHCGRTSCQENSQCVVICLSSFFLFLFFGLIQRFLSQLPSLHVAYNPPWFDTSDVGGRRMTFIYYQPSCPLLLTLFHRLSSTNNELSKLLKTHGVQKHFQSHPTCT